MEGGEKMTKIQLRPTTVVAGFILFCLFLCLFWGCSVLWRKLSPSSYTQAPGDISIMTYNVENLFDTLHDEGTEDYTFLPIDQKQTDRHKFQCEKIRSTKYREQCLYMDWSPSMLERKMHRLAQVILQMNHGRGPDILVMPEVENLRVLKLFNDKHLQPAQYTTLVHLEGPDKRGIDTSILSRLRPAFKPPALHKVSFQGRNPGEQKWMSRSRGILEARLLLPNEQELAVFAVHFPSPRNPTHWRQQAIVFLSDLQSQLPKDVLAIAAGDFNISQKEERFHHLYENQLGKNWLISHKLGCHQCKGTNYYHSGRQWSFLDAILFDKRLSKAGQEGPPSSWFVDSLSIHIPTQSIYQVSRRGSPARFNNGLSSRGVSDHWPVVAVLKPYPFYAKNSTFKNPISKNSDIPKNSIQEPKD